MHLEPLLQRPLSMMGITILRWIGLTEGRWAVDRPDLQGMDGIRGRLPVARRAGWGRPPNHDGRCHDAAGEGRDQR
ncbi:hypothetical protein FM114_15245 [Luteococcus japonicus LSP_Lj1]|uniref:Uncharacterized protein n=1 Tax=Luteococcus japonicus LSP_Lj1 TaxID=1255658 RepID=A0A1R4KJS3_9ACTN|nr:hypothetical protein FM114_15245 [Luteococcus japonicus LSP_Lj1]